MVSIEIPFYVYGMFNRGCYGGCDWCPFDPDEYTEAEGGVCPDNLWHYVMLKQNRLEEWQQRVRNKKRSEKP